MSGKYSGLPDIVRSFGVSASVRDDVPLTEQDLAPDVYETPDEPDFYYPQYDENHEAPKKTAPDGQGSIDRGNLPSRSKVERVFQDANLESAPQPKENQLNRLRRLQAEVAQLELEVHQSPPSSGTQPSDPVTSLKLRQAVVPRRQPLNVVNELSALRDKLDRASALSQRSERSDAEVNDVATRLSQLETVPTRTDSAGAAVLCQGTQIGDVDKRLTELEQLVGISSTPPEALPLSDTLARLNNLVNVLTQPRHVDTISRRLKALLADLDRASTSHKATSNKFTHGRPDDIILSVSDRERLEGLFELLPRMDPLLPVVPPLVTRLRSLSTLHAESLSIAAELRDLQSSEGAINEETRELQRIVANVQQGMSESAVSISNNWQSVQARLTALDERMAKLDM